MARKVGRPKNPPTAKELLKDLIPVKEMFQDDEIPIYESLVSIYLKDFDIDELTSSDVDDILTLATNKILEIRLLKGSRDDARSHIDISSSIEKIRKQSDKIKENLSSRRKDRIDPNEYKGFSIVNLAVAFDEAKKQEMEDKARQMMQEQKEMKKSLDKHGNKNDIDSISNNG